MSDTPPTEEYLPSELRLDAECLMKCPAFIVKKMGWSWDIPIEEWFRVTVNNGRITQLDLVNINIGTEGAKGLVVLVTESQSPDQRNSFLKKVAASESAVAGLVRSGSAAGENIATNDRQKN